MFVVRELLKRDRPVEPICNGMKILSIKYNHHIRFVDSYNFMPMALKKLPKTFDLGEIAKGTYPLLFNTPQNYDYIGSIPPLEYFIFDHDDREKMLEWHESLRSSNYIFNNRNELIKYCGLDVKILRKACVRYTSVFLELAAFSPLLQAITLAQTVLCVYRKDFMRPYTLGICPSNNYSSNVNQSFVGHKWLVWCNKQVNGRLRMEYRLPCNLLVDAYDPVERTCYEFLGCYYHSHAACIPAHRNHVYRNDSESGAAATTLHSSFNERNEQMRYKFTLLRNLKYKVVHMWECQFVKFLRSRPQLDEELSMAREIVYPRLQLREAIYGGRCEAFRLYYKAPPGTRIRMADYNSLYPYVCSKSKYVMRHPIKIMRGTECGSYTIQPNDEGFIFVRIEPPRNLYVPVLPMRTGNKLIFPLCSTCAKNMQIVKCNHTAFERAIVGVFPITEVRLALEFHYKILETIEVWLYDSLQFDPVSGEHGLFSDYMRTFIKLKQQSSGFPNSCQTDEDRAQYVRQFFESDGIHLDYEKINKNASMRQICKLFLNSVCK